MLILLISLVGAQSSALVSTVAAPPSLHPAPPSLQHAPSSHPPSSATTITGPPSLQVAPHVRPPASVQGPPGMQQGPPGLPVSHPGVPPGHMPSHPNFPRHLLPGMVPQRPEHGLPMMQRPGFPPMEHMPSLLSRPPMLPHWAAPRQDLPTSGGQSRRSPRPALPSMNSLARMGMPHLSMRQSVPQVPSGSYPPVSGGVPTAISDQSQASAPSRSPHEDPSQATIAAGMPRSSPAASPFQPVQTSQVSGAGGTHVAMQASPAPTTGTVTTIESRPTSSPVVDSKEQDQTATTPAFVPATGKSTEEGTCKTINTAAGVEKCEKVSSADNKEETGNRQPDDGTNAKECPDGIHCGTPPPQECTDGLHCGTPPPQECIDGLHCGTPPPQECTNGLHCGTPPPQECSDGLHCGTPPPQECTDGLHCGTPPPQECTDGLHCGTPPPQECTDGLHCGTPPPQECTDGLHCGTPPPQECTDGLHCGTPPPQECTDGLHCGTPPPQECTDGFHYGTLPLQECTDGLHCGTPPPRECTDGLHCGTPPPQECTDGLHCGTPPPQECTDGLHCGTPPPQECTDGLHCGTPPPQECSDGLYCGTPPPQECTDGLHCGTPPPQECTDGLHCGTPPPQECADGLHCGTPPPQECTDGLHCGTPPPQECSDGLHCGTPPPQECTDGLHCGTPPPQECTDGLHCGTPPPQECTDGLHCGTPPPQDQTNNESQSSSQPPTSSEQQPSTSGEGESLTVNVSHDAPPSLQPAMLSPQQLAVQADHQYVNVSHPPVLVPSHSDMQEPVDKQLVIASSKSSSHSQSPDILPTPSFQNSQTVSQNKEAECIEPAEASSQEQNTQVEDQKCVLSEEPIRHSPSESVRDSSFEPIKPNPSESEQSTLESARHSPSDAMRQDSLETVSQDLSEPVKQSPSKPVRNSSLEQETSHSQILTTFGGTQPTVVASQPPGTSNEISLSITQAPNSQHNVSFTQHQQDSSDIKDPSSDIKDPTAVQSETKNSEPTAKQMVSQDLQTEKQINDSETQRPVTPVVEPLTSLVQADETGKAHTQCTDKVEMAVNGANDNEQGPPTHQQVTVKTEVTVDPAQSVTCMHAKSGFDASDNMNIGEGNQIVSSSAASVNELGGKSPAMPEVKPEVQAAGVSPHLTTVPRPRHFRPVGMAEDVPRHMFPGRLPYPGPVAGRHPSQLPPDFKQQPGQPPVSQSAGQARQPQPAHFHESQLRFMQQMYQHQMAQGQRPQAAHQALHQLQGQQPYQMPPGFRGPMPGQPGFPPHFYQQHMVPPGAPRLQHPSSSQAGADQPNHVGASRSQSTSPKAQNAQRMPLPQSVQSGHPRHAGSAIPTEHAAQSTVPKQFETPATSQSTVPRQPETPHTTQLSKQADISDASKVPVPKHSDVPNVTQVPIPRQLDIPSTTQTVIKQEPVDYEHLNSVLETSQPNNSASLNSAHSRQQDQKATETKIAISSGGTEAVNEKVENDASQTSISGSSGKPSSALNTGTADTKESPVAVVNEGPQSTSQTSEVKPPTITPSVQGQQRTVNTPPVSQGSSVVSVPQPQEPASTSSLGTPTAEHQQQVSAPPRPLSGNRQSPGHSQPPGQEPGTSELTLPSVSATFAAAGMMRYGEGMHQGLPPYSQGHYRGLHPSATLSGHGPGFSSVSSIVQSVSSVSFPALSGTPSQHHIPASVPPAEVSLPPSTGISSDAVSSVGASASTQTPVHHKVSPHAAMASGQTAAGAVATEHMPVDVKPIVSGPPGPSAQLHRPGHPYPDVQGAPGAPTVPGPHGPRMPVPSHATAPPTTTQHGSIPRPRGPRQAQQQQHANQAAAMSRFPRIPSNLPPHLAGMLNNMRGPMPVRHMYQQERHPGMPPMGPMRFPPGSQGMMPMAPGGPGGYRMPVSQDGTPMSVPNASQMQVAAGVVRHPGMMQQMAPMRGMRIPGPGGPMMGPHPMQPHPSQMSPTGHPGAPPHMHQRMMLPSTSAGPLMGPPGLPQPSHPSPKEAPSPTQMLPQRPPTPGSMPSTPSPTSFHPGLMPTTSGAPLMAPGPPGEMHPRLRFPGQRMVMRMPFDGRMPFDPSMNMAPRLSMEGAQRMQGVPPDFQPPGMPVNKPGHPEAPQSPSGTLDDAVRRMTGGKPGPSPTPPQSGMKSVTPPAGSETTSASTTPPSPLVNIKQEQNLGIAFYRYR